MEMEASDALLEVTRKGKAAGGELRFSLHSAHPQQHSLTPALHPHFSSIPLLLPAGRFAGEILLASAAGGPGAVEMQC